MITLIRNNINWKNASLHSLYNAHYHLSLQEFLNVKIPLNVKGEVTILLSVYSWDYLQTAEIWISGTIWLEPVGEWLAKSTVFSSVQFSRSVVSDSLRPHESQHARPPCPSPTPKVYSNSCPSSRWCHPAISSSVVPPSCPQSLPASGSFPMSQRFAWGGQLC